MRHRRHVIVEAPSSLGLTTEGVEGLPASFLALGLADRVEAARSVRVAVPPKSNTIDPDTGILNAHEIAAWPPRLDHSAGSPAGKISVLTALRGHTCRRDPQPCIFSLLASGP